MENDCVFCDRKNLSAKLIAEDKNFYIFPTLGQITDGGYVLIVPKQHVRCLGASGTEEAAQLLEVSNYLRRAIKETYSCESTIFEHGIVGQSVLHAHLHVIPAVLDLSQKIRGDFPICETDALVSLRDLPRIYGMYQEPYLFWQTHGEAPMVCWNPPAPKQYLRLVAAEMVGRPERANWRTMDPELDKRLITETIAKLKPYFV